MMKRFLTIIFLAVLGLILFIPGRVSLATPTPPYVIINKETKECYITILGDDCSWCNPPAGWEVQGVATADANHACPDGYTRIEKLQMECNRYKNQFCCSGYSHHGNCEDMVVNEAQQSCAFVEDIQACNLPAGWSKRPESIDERSWVCPYSQWTENITCQPEPTPQDSPLPPIAAAGLLLAISGILAWQMHKRQK